MKRVAIIVPSYKRIDNILKLKNIAADLQNSVFFICDNSPTPYNIKNSKNFKYFYCGNGIGKANAIDFIPTEMLVDFAYVTEMDDDWDTSSHKLNKLFSNLSDDYYVIDHYNQNGKLVGDIFSDGDNYINFYLIERKSGDKQFIIRTRKWITEKYGVVGSEKFIPEDIKWTKILGYNSIRKIEGKYTKITYDNNGITTNLHKTLLSNRQSISKSKQNLLNNYKYSKVKMVKDKIIYYVYSNSNIRKDFPLKKKSITIFMLSFILKPYYLKRWK